MKPPFLPYSEPDLCNDYILKDLTYNDRFCINFLCHCIFDQVDYLLGNVFLRKNILQPTKKTKECRPTQIKTKENNKQTEIIPKEQKSQECEHTTT